MYNMYLTYRKIFSLEVLESSSYKIIMRDGILREIYGTLVILRGTRKEDLYFMAGLQLLVE